MRSIVFVAALILASPRFRCSAATLDLQTAKLTIDERGVATLKLADGSPWPTSDRPVFALQTERGAMLPEVVRLSGDKLDKLTVQFEGAAVAEFSVTTERAVAVFRLTRLSTSEQVKQFRLFGLPAPGSAKVLGTINAAESGANVAAVMAAEPNVHAMLGESRCSAADRAGCSHQFIRTEEAKAGRGAARFTATCNEEPGGWSVRGMAFPRPVDLSGCQAIRAWVHGDGKGELLKIQLSDGSGYRDNYLPIDFTGWRQVTLTECPINTLRYDRVTTLSFYYNGLPAGQNVACLIDQVEAVVQRDGKEQVVVLEDFESASSPLWGSPDTVLAVETLQGHGIQPAAFGVIACPRAEFFEAVQRFEQMAGLPSPHPGGAWNKTSPWIKRSYFFLTDFRESQFDEALAIARRGGFHTILLGQDSWCQSTGHYKVNRDRFPDGLEGLKRTVRRFHDAGFRVGLHFLGASIDPPDPYLTPVPDPRLVKGATTSLAADVDEKASLLPTDAAPETFPAEDGGYEGDGTVLQVGDELICYARRAVQPPYGFSECQRGHLGTKPAPHKKGDRVAHLVRSYGYHMFDMDTSLLDEVSANFARVANACEIDMIYFDGSERLQGDHWYYNARLHKAYYDKLTNKDMLLQASSYSHYSWHILARSASADGHGDLKGYLDERSPWFDSFARDGMPLDVGWYYGYDPNATLDQYEYILGATIGYDSSMSFQVSVGAAAAHPFTGDILDLIARYEKLRLSGRVDEAMKARLRVDAILGGAKKAEEREALLDHRRDYRLLGNEGQEVFQRVVYDGWHEVRSPDAAASRWTVALKDGPARVGFQVHVEPGPWLAAGPSYHAPDALTLENFGNLAPYLTAPASGRDVRSIGPGQSGATSPGVTQQIELAETGPDGKRCAVYSAASTRTVPDGWSVFSKTFDPPLDLSWHRAIGFWLRGDGKGGLFKLQLCDAKGATDYYVANDFVGWRYQQLARPETDPIDYRQVRSLSFYYNGLPAGTSVACGIGEVKSLRSLDTPSIVDPYVEIGPTRLAWKGTLNEGQYLVVWPGEPATRYGRPLKEPERSAEAAQDVALPAGPHEVKFGCANGPVAPVRVRVTLQPPERHPVP